MRIGIRNVSVMKIEEAAEVYRAKMCDERFTPAVTVERAERYHMAPTFAEFLEVNQLVTFEQVVR